MCGLLGSSCRVLHWVGCPGFPGVSRHSQWVPALGAGVPDNMKIDLSICDHRLSRPWNPHLHHTEQGARDWLQLAVQPREGGNRNQSPARAHSGLNKQAPRTPGVSWAGHCWAQGDQGTILILVMLLGQCGQWVLLLPFHLLNCSLGACIYFPPCLRLKENTSPVHRQDTFFWFSLSLAAGGASGKEPTCKCRWCRRPGFDPWVGKISWLEGMATHFSILAWRIPWTEEPGGP